MRFAEPAAFWLLPVLGAAVVLGLLLGAARRRALRRFAGGDRHLASFALEVGRNRRALRAVLLVVAAAFGILAAARPQWASGMDRIEQAMIER